MGATEFYEAYCLLPAHSTLAEVNAAAKLVDETLRAHRPNMRIDPDADMRVEGLDQPYAGCTGIEVLLSGSWVDEEYAASLADPKEYPCRHLADSEEWAEGLLGRPCTRCGRYYCD